MFKPRTIEMFYCSALCLVAVAMGSILWRNFVPSNSSVLFETTVPPTLLAVVHGGRTLYGSEAALMQITVFSDFQCPYCASLAKTLAAVSESDIEQVVVHFRHDTRSASHPHAYDAALAAECAGAQERFSEYHDALFESQAQIGVKSWTKFALAAGVRDTLRFVNCMKKKEHESTIIYDVQLANNLALNGTPSIIVGNRVIRGDVGIDSLKSLLKSLRYPRPADEP